MRRVLWSVVSTCLFFGIVEIGTRMVWSPPQIQNDIDVGMQLEPHPTRIWALHEGREVQFGTNITIDAQGMRQSSVPSQGERWLLLGDSSFFGHGLADAGTLHEQLQSQLLGQGYNISVRCGAVPGYSILQTKIFMEEVGWNLSPKLLLIGNLWSDNNFDHFVDQEWLDALQPESTLQQWLWKSHVFLWLHHSLRPPRRTEKGDPHQKISWIKEPYQTGRRRVEVNLYAQTLDELIQEAAVRGVGVVLIQPANRYRVEGSVPNATWTPYFEAQRMVASHRGVPIFDVAAYLRVFGMSAEEAFLDELHPTETANTHIASGLIFTLQASKWPEQIPLPSKDLSIFDTEIPDPWSRGVSFQSNTGQDTYNGVK